MVSQYNVLLIIFKLSILFFYLIPEVSYQLVYCLVASLCYNKAYLWQRQEQYSGSFPCYSTPGRWAGWVVYPAPDTSPSPPGQVKTHLQHTITQSSLFITNTLTTTQTHTCTHIHLPPHEHTHTHCFRITDCYRIVDLYRTMPKPRMWVFLCSKDSLSDWPTHTHSLTRRL